MFLALPRHLLLLLCQGCEKFSLIPSGRAGQALSVRAEEARRRRWAGGGGGGGGGLQAAAGRNARARGAQHIGRSSGACRRPRPTRLPVHFSPRLPHHPAPDSHRLAQPPTSRLIQPAVRQDRPPSQWHPPPAHPPSASDAGGRRRRRRAAGRARPPTAAERAAV